MSITRELYLQIAVSHIRDYCNQKGVTVPAVEVSCSWALRGRAANKKIGGTCFPKCASTGNINQITISPMLDCSVEVIDTLIHECIHAVDDCASGHGKIFRSNCIAVGMDGSKKMTSACAGDDLKTIIKGWIETDLGEYPHDKMTITSKPQSTRNMKMVCENETCNFSFRTSRKNINNITDYNCLTGCGGELQEAE
tara:strand:- start:927 stop:1514 length:588 start_codon:yes stop_codon:yes gene_type:complete